ncbi:PorP/SprF family type IX secretion system membrane protein [Marinirhabdus gelatinilytica]|uniref:Type IX secretion system PorP/SprF family membrane protein n=1 Tax=Marinirhabdus gelatinilytica TaxID=1703343 RepID=A0A370Q681_9FLAO|nr:type IX secretion system membrane protein PorP/SprF [Marinirhabdus gelatinilytica]RDK83872.1 type IX secretion system PorP/SprF family membrane protein [Marinirhabdus gelatinilytica]
MKKLYITVLALLALGLYTFETKAQQDAQYTQYMYNTLSINPAYAGSRDVFSFVGLYRSQWVGLEGAPRSFTASAHSPVGKKVGLGLNITRDEIFIAQETYIDVDFSYTLDVSDEGKLALGLKGGLHLLDIDTDRLNTGPFNPGDPQAQINIDNKLSPQIGAGVYYYTQKFYLGISAPNFIETEHFDESSNSNNSSATAKERVNYYLMTGYTFDVTENLKFKPAFLLKYVDGAPLGADLSANFLIHEKLTLGAAYRWSAAFSGLVGFQITDQLMLGLAYDRETTELQQYNDGSYEVFLRFELFNKKKRMISPRFF